MALIGDKYLESILNWKVKVDSLVKFVIRIEAAVFQEEIEQQL